MADSPHLSQSSSAKPSDKFAPAVWIVGFLGLMSVTWPLWWPSDVYPVVPLLGSIDEWLDIERLQFACRVQSVAAIVGMILLAALVFLRSDASRSDAFRRLSFLMAVVLLVGGLLDTHRLQPWYYQTALYLFAASTRRPKRWIAWVTASIYIFSALGKFDFEFAHSIGQQMVSAISIPLERLSGIQVNEQTQVIIARFLPLPEFLAGVLWVFTPTRRTGAYVSAFMHVVLLLLLGPWMLNHSLGVIGWNLLLLLQSIHVIRNGMNDESPATRSAIKPKTDGTQGFSLLASASSALLIAALVLPIAERSGYWDHWLSWALYSPHVDRITVEVHRRDLADVSYRAGHYVDDEEGQWKRLNLGKWALGERRCPVYPQARYQLKLVLASTENVDPRGVRVVVWSVSDRWTGERKQVLLGHRDEIASHLRKTSWLD